MGLLDEVFGVVCNECDEYIEPEEIDSHKHFS